MGMLESIAAAATPLTLATAVGSAAVVWTCSRAPLQRSELRPTSTFTLMGIISSHIPTEQFPLESQIPRNIPLLLNSMEYSPRVFTAMMPPDPTVPSEGRKRCWNECSDEVRVMHRDGIKGIRPVLLIPHKQSMSTQQDPARLVISSTSPDEYSMIVQGQ